MDETNNSIVKLETIKRYLAEVKTVDEAKAYADKYQAMRHYAKRAKLGIEVQNDAAEAAILFERRAGEFLKELNLRKNSLANLNRTSKPTDNASRKTLAELGIKGQQSEDWQLLASTPEEEFNTTVANERAGEKELSTAKVVKKLRKAKQKKQKAERKAEPITIPDSDRFLLAQGDISEMASKIKRPDVIITDPPYPREYLHLYGVLAETAAAILSPGGSLLVMTGQSYLPEVIELMKPHLNYQWMLSYLTPGGQATQIFPRKVITFWKPVLWFTKGEYKGDWIGDVIKSAVNDNDKRFHDWGQSESGMAELIEKFTDPGQTILDPFCGGGTTGVVAVRLNRRFIGIDIDPEAIRTTAERLSREVAS